MKLHPASVFGAIATGIVVVSIVAGVVVMGSPKTIRAQRLDDKRVENLRMITDNVRSYFNEKEKLPENLNEGVYAAAYWLKDPETGEFFEYHVTGPLAYQLCATFAAEATEDTQQRYSFAGLQTTSWAHPAGRKCFDLTVEKPKKDKVDDAPP